MVTSPNEFVQIGDVGFNASKIVCVCFEENGDVYVNLVRSEDDVSLFFEAGGYADAFKQWWSRSACVFK